MNLQANSCFSKAFRLAAAGAVSRRYREQILVQRILCAHAGRVIPYPAFKVCIP